MIIRCRLSHLKLDTYFTTDDGEDYVKIRKDKFMPIPQVELPPSFVGRPFTPAWYSSKVKVIADSSRVRTRFQRFFGLNK
ncbi:hypothetical protein CPT_Muldoon_057 [Serratia phage Muldoon]|uniref:Uncharacterized protein n=1 Tax=Serratia phage Muldoon TaxID=2601678 RepID=A0A5P8PH53_9CAUD|nr:hypothetical protein HYP94_gp056 [Serratia phage Muldoon]QFR56013.1 hypothetical protein CPT_Muldoon_057 [Serratia phage Muldoon]